MNYYVKNTQLNVFLYMYYHTGSCSSTVTPVTPSAKHEGASYIRWGRKTCEGNATLVYEGELIVISLP